MLLWTPGLSPEGLFSFQAALQHSHKKGFAMQRKTSHPPRGSVWAGVELGAAVLPQPGLHAPAPAPCHVLGHSCLWHPHLSRWDHGDPLSTVPQGQSSAWHHGGDALLPTGLGLLPPSNAGFPQPTEQGQGGWHGWHHMAGFLGALGMESTVGRQCRCGTGRVWALRSDRSVCGVWQEEGP